jgi:hypothetical protein
MSIWGLGFRDEGSGFRVWGSGFCSRVRGLGFGVWGSQGAHRCLESVSVAASELTLVVGTPACNLSVELMRDSTHD